MSVSSEEVREGWGGGGGKTHATKQFLFMSQLLKTWKHHRFFLFPPLDRKTATYTRTEKVFKMTGALPGPIKLDM